MPDEKQKLEMFNLGPMSDLSEEEILDRVMKAVEGFLGGDEEEKDQEG